MIPNFPSLARRLQLSSLRKFLQFWVEKRLFNLESVVSSGFVPICLLKNVGGGTVLSNKISNFIRVEQMLENQFGVMVKILVKNQETVSHKAS